MGSSVHLQLIVHTLRRTLSAGSFPVVKLALVALWAVTLWWGEKSSFERKTNSCQWDAWENWPAGATPHRLVLLADPQLVDPHTYPGRPWPLSKLTVLHTDQYLRRSFLAIQHNLDPDSIVFLGDLFDGGREWATLKSENPDQTWKGYGEDFWLTEYDRWGRIFLVNNGQVARTSGHPRGDRKIIASLPGNHDLGISTGVRLDVRERFEAFFGPGNRVDMIGNHSFVSVDTVSLTAKALDGAQERGNSKAIWGPASDFLDNVQKQKAQTLERYLSGKLNKPENPRLDHSVSEVTAQGVKEAQTITSPGLDADVPTVLLTHVPLYRAEGMQCGPLRERYPPSKDGSTSEEPIVDMPNALRIASGYQYQNVLHPEISQELIEKIGNVVHVFSGDDHDYCEVVHKGYTAPGGGVREITVKSMSWAMGVRHPGFLLVSLWNPIDEKGNSVQEHIVPGAATIQTKLCLLPDVIATLIWYGQLLALTVVTLAVAAFRASGSMYDSKSAQSEPLLPLNRSDSRQNQTSRSRADSSSCSASSNSSESSGNGLAVRSYAQRTRSVSPGGGWAMPVQKVDMSSFYTPPEPTQLRKGSGDFSVSTQARSKRPRWQLFAREFRSSLLQVGAAGLLWYAWLAHRY